MALQTIVSLVTDETAADISQQLTGADGQIVFQNLLNYMGRIKSSITPATVGLITSPLSVPTLVQATGTITSTGIATAADTLNVCGVTITAVAANPTANEFIPSAVVATQASRIAAVVNTSASFTGLCTASAALGVVTVTSYIPGVYGNLQVLTESMANVAVSGSGTLAGGTGVINASQLLLLLNTLTSYAINR